MKIRIESVFSTCFFIFHHLCLIMQKTGLYSSLKIFGIIHLDADMFGLKCKNEKLKRCLISINKTMILFVSGSQCLSLNMFQVKYLTKKRNYLIT